MLLADVTAEDGHGTDAKAQGEEGLVHGRHQCVDHAHLLHTGKIGHQIELEALFCAGHEQAVDRQHHHDGQQSDHHDLGHPLQTVLQALGAHQNAQRHHEHHPEGHHAGAGQHLGELTGYLLGVQAGQLTDGGHVEIVQHPAGHRGVEHHQQIATDQGEIAVDVPFLARLFQCLIGPHRALAGGTAHRKLHGHDGQTQNDQKNQIKQHECAAAALTGNIGELPHVADADGAARGKQDEAQAGLQGFSFHDSITSLFPICSAGRTHRAGQSVAFVL